MRRLAGFISMLLMLHLTLVGSDLVCAKHDGAAANMSSTAHGDAHSQYNHPAQAHSEQADACETPVTPNCCAALASCSTVVLGSTIASRDTNTLGARLPVGPTASALSRLTPPDTPPPRA